MVAVECRSQLLHAGTDRPLRLELGQGAGELAAVHPIAARIRATALGVADVAAGHDVLHHLGEIADAVVLFGAADVERLVVHHCARRVQHGEKGAGDILDVHQRSPGCAVAQDQHVPGRVGNADEVVDDDVRA